MFDELDLFIINNYAKDISISVIGDSIDLTSQEVENRIKTFKSLVGNIPTGMKFKLDFNDIFIINCMLQRMDQDNISKKSCLSKDKVQYRIKKLCNIFEKLNDYDVPKKSKAKDTPEKKERAHKKYVMPSQDKEIIKLLNEGHQPKDIADMLKTPIDTIYYRIRLMERNGIVHMRTDKDSFITDSLYQQVVDLKLKGYTDTKVAAELGLSKNKVGRMIARMQEAGYEIPNVPTRKKRGYRGSKKEEINNNHDAIKEQIISYLRQGLNIKQIAKELGFTFYRTRSLIVEIKKEIIKGIKAFIETRNPTIEQLQEMIEIEHRKYGIDVSNVFLSRLPYVKDDIDL